MSYRTFPVRVRTMSYRTMEILRRVIPGGWIVLTLRSTTLEISFFKLRIQFVDILLTAEWYAHYIQVTCIYESSQKYKNMRIKVRENVPCGE